MGKFVNLFFLLLVVKSIVSEDVKSELKYTAQASNPSDQTHDEIKPNINFWEDPTNPHFGINDEDENQENESTRPVVAQTIEALLNDPEIIAALLEPENVVEIPSLLIKFKHKLIHGIFDKLGINRHFLKYNLFARDRTFNPGFRNHIIRKRDIGLWSSFLENLSKKLKSEGDKILLKKLKTLKHILQTEKDILHSTGLFNRKQKRSIIPDIMFNYFSSLLFSESQNEVTAKSSTPELTTDEPTDPETTTDEATDSEPTTIEAIDFKPTTDEATEPEPTSDEPTNLEQTTFESSTPVPSTAGPSTPEPITLKSLQDKLEEILPPQLDDYPTVADQINSLVAIEDEQLKSTIRNAIKTDDSDERTIMYNIDIPEMKSDAIYVQRLSGSAADNMAAFLKQFEMNNLQNFDFKLLEPEIFKEKDETEEKHDDEDCYPVNDEEEEEEEEDDA